MPLHSTTIPSSYSSSSYSSLRIPLYLHFPLFLFLSSILLFLFLSSTIPISLFLFSLFIIYYSYSTRSIPIPLFNDPLSCLHICFCCAVGYTVYMQPPIFPLLNLQSYAIIPIRKAIVLTSIDPSFLVKYLFVFKPEN